MQPASQGNLLDKANLKILNRSVFYRILIFTRSLRMILMELFDIMIRYCSKILVNFIGKFKKANLKILYRSVFNRILIFTRSLRMILMELFDTIIRYCSKSIASDHLTFLKIHLNHLGVLGFFLFWRLNLNILKVFRTAIDLSGIWGIFLNSLGWLGSFLVLLPDRFGTVQIARDSFGILIAS